MKRFVLAGALLALSLGAAAQTKLKVGLMLPASGTFASLGSAIEKGFGLYFAERGGRLCGRELNSSRSTTRASPRRRPTTSTS